MALWWFEVNIPNEVGIRIFPERALWAVRLQKHCSNSMLCLSLYITILTESSIVFKEELDIFIRMSAAGMYW